MLFANGRLSDRSFPRYRLFSPLVRRVMRQYDRVLAREDLDRDRFAAIGAPLVETSGNVKFDYELDETPLAIAPELVALIAGRPVFILGSTLEGEDEMLLREITDEMFVIIAPRKPERFEAVAGLVKGFVRRSELRERCSGTGLILDSTGHLRRLPN